LGIIHLFVLSPTYVIATGVFPIIELEKNLNKANILINIYNPPNIIHTCTNKSNENISCSYQFSLILPQWLQPYEGGVTIYEPRRFFLYNPETSAELIDDCRKFSSGTEYITDIGLSKTSKGYKFKVYDTTIFTPVSFDWNLEKGASSCYIYKIPVYNPHIVNQTLAKYYPFDSYELKIGFSFPYQTDFQGLIIIPEEFTITNFSINATQKILETKLTRNIGYFNFKPIINEPELFLVKFYRIPDLGSRFLVFFILLGLPAILITFFWISSTPEQDRTRMSRITAFYLAIVPFFFSMTTFLNDKPSIFTIFDALMAISITSLVLNVIKDFLFPNWFTNKKIRGFLSLILVVAITVFFFLK